MTQGTDSDPSVSRRAEAGGEPMAPPSVRDHLANERTLLAWIRTSLTVIGLGFIVDRLASDTQRGGLAAYAGVGLVLLGSVVALAGAYSYLAARRDLATGTYRPAVGLHLVIVAVVALGAVAVAVFLVTST
jgi:putative membrane protein